MCLSDSKLVYLVLVANKGILFKDRNTEMSNASRLNGMKKVYCYSFFDSTSIMMDE